MRDIEIVLDEVGSPKTTLFGLWDGCLTATLFAATHPQRTASLVLFGSSPTQTSDDDFPSAWADETGRVADQHPRGLGHTGLGRPERALDGPEHDRRLCRARALDHLHPLRRRAVVRRGADAPEQGHRFRGVCHLCRRRRSCCTARVTRSRRSTRADTSHRRSRARGSSSSPATTASHGSATPSAVLGEVERFVAGLGGSHLTEDRRLATVLFTDIVGSTEHLVSLGDTAWQRRLAEHDAIVRRNIDRRSGRFVGSAGDGALAMFDGPAAAVKSPSRSWTSCGPSASRCAQASTPARSSSAAAACTASPSTSARVSPRWPGRARYSSPRSCATSPQAAGYLRGCRRARAQGHPRSLAPVPRGRTVDVGRELRQI